MQVTTKTILNWLKESVESKTPVPPTMWIDAAQKLNVLLGDEHDALFDLQQEVAEIKFALLQEGRTVSAAQVEVETTAVYKGMQKQKAKIGRIEEFIRIAKIQGRLRDTEFKGY